jgi:Zn-finger nucleic acid-binding protein
MLICPRDTTSTLQTVTEHGIEIDRCPACQGAWYDFDELPKLESTVAPEDAASGMVEYSKHESTITCPVGGEPMVAFNYRAYNLELDGCPAEHGFWLDAGESERVREIMRERVRGLHRAGSAQKAWNRSRGRDTSRGVIDQIRNLFRR